MSERGTEKVPKETGPIREPGMTDWLWRVVFEPSVVWGVVLILFMGSIVVGVWVGVWGVWAGVDAVEDLSSVLRIIEQVLRAKGG